uniref:HTH OST-type domain-containing protein n=1 Tax=Entomoneis paludosa TaxID=265537 RepID=A0A7S2YFJ2_9STRA|mmetsp:Transcript_31019/g.64722  ORF Transcript_31019/g.64722 Transcript_31019/m.64722 type:complete len:115 (+) Transcript_31019:2-346(+)
MGSKTFLTADTRKKKIITFKAMGIAWDVKFESKNVPVGVAEEIQFLLRDQDDGKLEMSQVISKYTKKYKSRRPSFERGKLGEFLESLSLESGLFHVKAQRNGTYMLCLSSTPNE